MAPKLTGFKAISAFANNKMDPRLFRNLCDILTGIQDRYDIDGFNQTLEDFREHVLRTDNPHKTKIAFNYTDFITTLYRQYKKWCDPNTPITKTAFVQRARQEEMFVLEIIRRVALCVYLNQNNKLPNISSRFPRTPSPILTASVWTPLEKSIAPLNINGLKMEKMVNLNANTLIMTVWVKNPKITNTTIKICTFLNTTTNDEITIEHDPLNKLIKIMRNGTRIAQAPMQAKTTFAVRWTETQIDIIAQSGMDISTSQYPNTNNTFDFFDKVFFHMPFKRKANTSTIRQTNLYSGYLLDTETLSIMDASLLM